MFLEKNLERKSYYNQRFEYSPLVSELKKLTDIANEQYQRLDKVYKFEDKEEDKTKIIDKTKNKKRILSQIYYTIIDLLFSNTKILKYLLIFFFKQKVLKKSLRLN